jgi:hypothetical protein
MKLLPPYGDGGGVNIQLACWSKTWRCDLGWWWHRGSSSNGGESIIFLDGSLAALAENLFPVAAWVRMRSMLRERKNEERA